MTRKKGLICLGLLLLGLLTLLSWYCSTHLWRRGHPIRSVSAGLSHSIILLTDGHVWGWGDNAYDQLGNGAKRRMITPVLLQGLHNICMIEAGSNHAVALDARGFVWTWGQYGTYRTYLLDQGNSIVLRFPEPTMLPELSNIVMVAAGNHHSLALDNHGRVWAWGQNGYGQLGDGTVNAAKVPIQVGGLDNVVAISAGALHSLALKSDGTVWGWGNNIMKQLGSSPDKEILNPRKIEGVENIVQISGGFGHSVALGNDGRVWVWGVVDWTDVPEITDNVVIDQYYDPTPFDFAVPVIAIDAGGGHSIDLLENGQVWAWGTDSFGQLGNSSSRADAVKPVQVTGLPAIKLLAAGNSHNVVVDESGNLWAWGLNDDNQVGTSSLIESLLNMSLKNHPELSDYVLEPRKVLNSIEMNGPEISCP
ncbi:MAG: hypothetical protein JXB07_19410 [Anaerolineae bacterium]|nr:hypothetical protein [Anaerolineae bacterium]